SLDDAQSITAPHPSSDDEGLHSQPAQSSPAQRSCSSSSDTAALRSPLGRIFHSYDGGLGISPQWLKKSLKPSISMVVGIGGFVLACVALWSTMNATSDGRKAEILAEWTAKKDFMEFCQTVSGIIIIRPSLHKADY